MAVDGSGRRQGYNCGAFAVGRARQLVHHILGRSGAVTRRHLITAAGVLGWVVATHAAATWQTKPYYTWTDVELKEVLTDSPWADKGTISYFVPAGGVPKGGSPQAIEDVALVSWVSALPLRQAGVRQQIPVGMAPPKEAEDA